MADLKNTGNPAHQSPAGSDAAGRVVPLHPQQEALTVMELLLRSAEHLKERGFEDARLNVELLLAHVLRCRRLDLYVNFDRPLDSGEIGTFKELYRRRLSHEPLQYHVGETRFMGLPVAVAPGVLIPRPETELLAEKALEMIARQTAESVRVLDIGTGSGCIAIALAKLASKEVIVDGCDASSEAINVASRNVEANAVAGRVTLIQADILSDGIAQMLRPPYDLIVSNPPYVPSGEIPQLKPEVRAFEPLAALDGGEDGLRVIARIISLVPLLLGTGGTLMLEIGYNEAYPVIALLSAQGFRDVQTMKDYAGIERVVSAGLKEA